MRVPPDRICRQNGFSLVELMVALAILGLMAGVVVMTMPASNGDVVRQATQLAARIAALRDRSVIEGRDHGVWLSPSGYGFDRRLGGVWQALNDGRLARSDWSAGTAVAVGSESSGRVTFNRIGLPSRSVAITLRQGDSNATVRIAANGDVAAR